MAEQEHSCYPATQPGDGCTPWKCEHGEDAHHSIDGEAAGCTMCEAMHDAIHTQQHECPRCTDLCRCADGTYRCSHACSGVARGERDAISESLVAPLFGEEERVDG